MQITINNYKTEYHDKIVEIITSIQQREFGLSITYADQPDLADINSFYDAFLVALYEGLPVGPIGFKKIDDFAVIRKMFVQADFRGKIFGTAQQLLNAIEVEISKQHIKKIYLGTTEFFKAAHKFYARNNYAEIYNEDLPASFPVMTIDTKFYFKII